MCECLENNRFCGMSQGFGLGSLHRLKYFSGDPCNMILANCTNIIPHNDVIL